VCFSIHTQPFSIISTEIQGKFGAQLIRQVPNPKKNLENSW
jgi:hypothetical protein